MLHRLASRAFLRKTLAILLVAAILLVGTPLDRYLTLSGAAQAATTLTVDDLGDTSDAIPGDGLCADASGKCTLRAAIQEANKLAGDDTITFSVTGTIDLASELPFLSTNLTINGPGADQLTVQRSTVGTPNFRIFTIDNPSATVLIHGLTISNGVATFTIDHQYGGGIQNLGILTITNCTISDNEAPHAGGIYNEKGTLNIINSTISNNRTKGFVGGIFNDNTATLNITNSTISNNHSDQEGGGVYFFNGSNGNIINSTISNNSAYQGGGITNYGAVTMSSSIIANNNALLEDPDLRLVAGTFTSQGYNLIGKNPAGFTVESTDQVGTLGSPLDPQLGPLAYNGGPTQTHALQSGSPAIDKGKNFSGLNTDQRGFTRPLGTALATGGDGTDIGAFESPLPPNQPPVNTVPGTQTILEDSTLVFSSANGNLISISDPDAGSSSVQVTLSVTNGGLTLSGITGLTFTAGDGISDQTMTFAGTITDINAALNGLTFTPETNFNGTAILSLTTNDQGNTGSGGAQSDADSVTVNITGVNDAPSFTKGANQTVNEDAGAQTVTNWATSISAGPANESGQTLDFIVTNSNNALFSVQPSINPAGDLTYTPAPDANGSATISVSLHDNGGIANGGLDTSDTFTFTITVIAVNDPPTLTNNTGIAVNEGSTGNTIDSSKLRVSDVDNTDAQLTYTIGTPPSKGTLRKGGTPLVNASMFTQDDINNNLIAYDHDGSETTSDSFSFTVSDGAGGNIGSTNFNITVTPVNDAPSLTTNAGLSILPGASGAIDNTKLLVTDPDNTAVQLVYTVGIAPAHGALLKSGVPLSSGSTFSQDDINNNRITFTHNGDAANSDSFTFTVSDGAGATIGATTFNIGINCIASTVVTNTNDSGAGSLRDAIITACPGNTIAFNIPTSNTNYDSATGVYTITLTSGELSIDRNLTIQGPTAVGLTISGNNIDPDPNKRSRIFNVTAGNTVVISNLTIANGEAPFGGGIYNLGNLTIKNSTFNGNKAVGAGAEGGAVDSEGGTLTITNATISGNTSDEEGGGLLSCGSSITTLTNVTITNNRADADGNGSGDGGGIAQVSSNPITLRNTIVAGNFKGTGTTANDVFVLSSTSIDAAKSKNNLIGVDIGVTDITNGSNGNQIGTAGAPVNALLGTLYNNGGPTRTHLLLPGSPAINAGDNTLAKDQNNNALTIDQRGTGFNRVVNRVDIGAVEVDYSISATSGTSQIAIINTAFGTNLQATVTESGINRSGISVTFTAPASGASGTFPGNVTTANASTDSSGVATAPLFTANGTVGGPYNVAASLGTGLPTATFALTNTKAQAQIKFSNILQTYDGSPKAVTATIVPPGLMVSITYDGSSTAPTTVKAGGYAVVATINDANYQGMANTTLTINKASSTTTVTVANAVFDGNSHGGTAAATGAGGLNQNLTVNYTGRNATTYGPSVTAPTNVGDYTASATFGGDNNHNGSNNSKDFQITKANQTISFNALSAKTFVDPDFTVSATASSNLAVSFAASPASVCTIIGNTVHIVGAGSCQITASQTGNSNFNAATDVQQSFSISKANQTITFNVLADKTFGNADFAVSATASSNLPVSFAASGQCTVAGNQVHITSAGSCTITASQAGSSNFNAATSIAQTFNIAKAVTTTTVTSSANPSDLGQSVTFTAIVTSTAGTPTGRVQFKIDGTNSGAPIALTAGGVATLSTSSLTVGPHVITTDYSGDANFAFSTGSLSGGQGVNTQASLSIPDVSVTEGNSGTTNAVFTVTLSSASNLTVKVDFSTAPGTATSGSDYQSTSGTLTFNPGDLTKNISVLVNGDTLNEPNETFFVNLSNAVNTTISDAQGIGTILNDDAPGVQFSSNNYRFSEAAGHGDITVTRTGDLSTAITVDYMTSDQSGLTPCQINNTGFASDRCDYATAVGTLRFAAGEQVRTIPLVLINDAYMEGPEQLTIRLMNPQGASLSLDTATVIITDDETQLATTNPIDAQAFFIRQQYIDFLGREPEDAGFNFWMNRMNNCPAGQVCDRIDTSLRFFQSDEFQERGFYVYRLYDATLGRLPHYTDFVPDVARLNGPQTVQEQRLGKDAYLMDFMNKSEFKNLYGQFLSANNLTATDAAGFVNALCNTSGITPASKQTLITNLQSGARDPAHTLEDFILTPELSNVGTTFYDRGFIVMQYFGYLRRDPESEGFDFWRGQLVGSSAPHKQDYHFMVSGFLNSDEYRFRFALLPLIP